MQQPNERIVLNWTDEETIKFIEIYQRDSSNFDLGRRRKNRDAYQKMSSEMETFGYFRSSDQLIRKMKRLRFDYKRARAKGSGSKEFKYYEPMDLMFQSSSAPTVPFLPLPNNVFRHYTVLPSITAGEEEPDVENAGTSEGDNRLANMEDIQEVYAEHLQSALQTSPHHSPLGSPLLSPLQSPLQSSPGSSDVLDELREEEKECGNEERNFVKAPPAKRRRASHGIGLTEILVSNVMKIQQNTERQYVHLLEKQMALEEERRRDNQEFQLRLVALLGNLPLQGSHCHGGNVAQCQLQNRTMAVQAVRNVGRLAANSSFFFLCDMQEQFRSTIKYYPEIITVANKMVKAANTLDIPVVITEQYPKALGNTVQEIDVSKARGVFAKTIFSMVVPDVVKILEAESSRKSVVLFGIEAQVCVQQTALDLVAKGYDVHVVADAVSSRTLVDRMFALDRMRQSGVFVSTSESVIFELMGDSKHPKFKELQPLIKESAPDSALLPKL